MKKLFLSMLAAVTLFASCSEEELVSQTGNESLVSFSVITPEMGSRAATIGDGESATDLYYAVYDETAKEIVTTISKTESANKETITVGTVKKISLSLLNGHKYSLVFWAENPACPYAVDWVKKSINLDAKTLNSNSETYDAFYAYVPPFTVAGEKTSTIELKRPFAQLNIGTTLDDLKGVSKYFGLGDKLFTQSSIVVTTPTSMDLTTGNVSGEKELTFAAANFLTEKLKGDYEYLSMNYLLVSNEKSLVDVKFSVIDGTTIIDKTFENIPVQRNYRTNIYGNLFTTASEWNVELKPEFDKDEYNTAELLKNAIENAENGDVVTLVNDVELSEILVISKNITLDGNGKTITSTAGRAINVSGANDVTIKNLVIDCKGERGINVIQNSKKVTIENVKAVVANYAVNVASSAAGAEISIVDSDLTGLNTINIAAESVKVDIKNTKITCDDKNNNEKYSAIAFNKDGINSHVTVSGGEIIVKDDSSAGKLVAEGATIMFDKDVKGSTVIEDCQYYIEYGDYQYSFATFADALDKVQNGETIVLSKDVVISETFSVDKDIKINLNGYDFDASGNASRPFNVENGKLTIVGGNSTIKVGAYGLVNIPVDSDAEIVLEGGIYEGNTDNGALLKPRGEGKINITLKNVKYNDKSNNGYVLNLGSYEGEQFVIKVEGGEFVAGGGFQLTSGSSIKNTTIKNTNPSQLWNAVEFTGDATIENSTIISEGYAITTGFGAKATVKNCSVESKLYAYCVYPTGGEINVTGGSYVGQYYIYDLYTGAAAEIVIDNDTKVSK